MENLSLIKIYGRECSVCFDKSSKVNIVTKCGHPFCFDCIQQWSQKLNTLKKTLTNCPVCQKTITKTTATEQQLQLRVKRLTDISKKHQKQYRDALQLYTRMKALYENRNSTRSVGIRRMVNRTKKD